ncbi:MAG: hypothetical protein M1812_007786 [Candelaria pacifica]|nr:MAG: hypothetical protein M1812_007786 [Candelaria pacifica]
MAMNAINIIGVGLMAGDLIAEFANKPPAAELITNVAIGVGTGLDTMAGNCPNVNVYNAKGERAGQSKSNEHLGGTHRKFDAKKAKKVTITEKQVITLAIENKQLPGGAAQIKPAYLKLTAFKNDGICIASVSASGDGVQWGWFGDNAKPCGAQWYHSNKFFGDGTYQPSCIWLDGDFSKGIFARGISMHMQDFSTAQAVYDQFTKHPDQLCKSAKRMTMYHDTLPDDDLLMRFPGNYGNVGVGYNPDGTDKNPKYVIDNKATYGDPNLPAPKPGKRFRRDDNSTVAATPGFQEGHLIISDHGGHSAKELCDHPGSLGPDFVSTEEGIFCDMTAREYWFLCSATLTTGCFDLDKQQMVGAQPGIATRDLETGRIIPDKQYDSSNHWKRDEWRYKRATMTGWKRSLFDIYSGHWRS